MKENIRVVLDGRVLDDFNYIKQTRNFEMNTEAIRYCITETAKATGYHIPDDQVELIKTLLSSSMVRSKWQIYDANDFIKKALDYFIDSIRSDMPSIQDFDVRATLTDDEATVAMAIIEVQAQAATKMFTLDELMAYLQTRNHRKINTIVEGFVDRLILSKQVVKGVIYYHARE